MISVRNTEAGVKPIEESGVVQNQLETKESGVLLNQIQTKGWSAVAEPSPPTVGLDVVNEPGTRDVEETTILLRNTEDSSGSVQIEPAKPEQEYRFMGTDVSKVVDTVRSLIPLRYNMTQ
ncbi:hypothetical protein M0R45_004395 [Rubus argutus]|uniref:Uncharacterized protein n=1 Tax=Rubus argutus TaxID=59490 RepID=A0AAW1YJM8_RUBAR